VLDRGLEDIASVFPVLKQIDLHPKTEIELVKRRSGRGAEHYRQDSLRPWLPRQDHHRGLAQPRARKAARRRVRLQCKFGRLQEVHKSALKLSEEFYKTVQLDCAEWVKLGTTKTAMVYGLGSVPVKNHE
jgi:hypothetical protein